VVFFKLNNGVEMPALGLGVFQLTDARVCEASVAEALRVGYRLIDTAARYGNEEAVGKAIRESGIARADIFVTTKLWVQDAGYEKTRRGFETSLEKLKLDYLDLYLIHQPYGDVFGSWRAMEELHREGRIRAIGVSNFHNDRVMDLILHSKVAPAVNQIETHPFQQQLQAASFLAENNVQIQSWAPFAEGRNNLFTNETLMSIGGAHGKSVAQVVLRWLVQRGVAAIPKSLHADRIAQNFQIFDFQLTPPEMEEIKTLDLARSLFFDHRDPEAVRRVSALTIEGR
jgi:diketogulonate reductase-like aldo/keto reductase